MNAHVTILTAAEPASEQSTEVSFDAVIISLDPPLMELAARVPAEPGSALRIRTDDAIWLGDAERSVASGDDYAIRVRLRHVLRDFETLERLAERFSGASARRTAEQQPPDEYPLKEQTVRI